MAGLDPRREQSIAEIAAGVAATRRFIAERPGDVSSAVLWNEVPRSAGPDPDPPGDRVGPETVITAGPRGVVRSAAPRRRVRLAFAATEADARFECRLDGGRYEPCASPTRVPVGAGRHRFAVRAIDASGNADPTPALRSWRVRR